MARAIPATLALLLLSTGALLADAQESLGLTPARISIKDAQVGQAYHFTVTLQNQYDSPTSFTVERNGTVGGWTVVDPSPQFTMAARSTRTVDLTITPPPGTGLGNKTGQVSFVADVRGSTRQGVGVLLEASVGGEPSVQVTWISASADDVQAGDPLQVNVTARNDGNVRTRVQAEATLTALGGGPNLAQASDSVELDPGQTGDVVIDLGSSHAVGQYSVHVASKDPTGFEADVDVKVTLTGTAPDGWLRAIDNPIRVLAGRPVTFSAWFENTGRADIGSARLSAQVLRDGQLEATLGSEGVAVPAGTHVNLTSVWTPARSGAYRIVGHVDYDGFQTPDSEGRIEVGPSGSGIPWLLVALVISTLAAVAFFVILGVRRPGAKPPTRPRPR